MEVANGGREWRICEVFIPDSPFCVWMSTPQEKWCFYDQKANVSSLLKMRKGIRLFMGSHAFRANVSYLAQTRYPDPVILVLLVV
jgi:hypothetical protein